MSRKVLKWSIKLDETLKLNVWSGTCSNYPSDN